MWRSEVKGLCDGLHIKDHSHQTYESGNREPKCFVIPNLPEGKVPLPWPKGRDQREVNHSHAGKATAQPWFS